MSKSKTPKKEAVKKIDEFFSEIKKKTPREVRKMKKLAMGFNLKLGEKKKSFCKKCLNPYSGNERVRLKNNTKILTCENCGHVSRWKIK